AVEQVIQDLRSSGGQVVYIRADVGDREARSLMVREVKTRLGRLNVLVNNAGVAPRERKDILEASEESFEWVFRVNAVGPYFLTQAIANWMIEKKREPGGFSGCIRKYLSSE